MTFINVLGTSGCKYDYGNDTASSLINNKIIVDTGWNLVENILDAGLNPAEFKTILFTHLHHDHYIALPQFIFYHVNAGTPLRDLKLIGPPEINNILKLAVDFLQLPRFFDNIGEPQCVEIKSGESIALDDEQLFIEAGQSVHPVDGRFYRVTDMLTGAKLGFTGDTAYSSDGYKIFKGCDLLVHECSLGGRHTGDNSYLHADAHDAAVAALEAGVKTLVLTHYPARLREECINAASLIFHGEILTPVKGDIIYIN